MTSPADSGGGAPPITLSGYVTPQFEAVREPLARVVASQGSGGAALAVYLGGAAVVDLAAGEYSPTDRQLVFSIGKFATAVAAQLATGSGLELDAPISDVWPAFRRASTRMITTRMVLSHRSGIVAIEEPMTLAEMLDGRADEAIERAEPAWEPGTAHGYHLFTYGLLLDGVFRHAIGVDVAHFLRTMLTEPHGIDFTIGARPAELANIRPVRLRALATTQPAEEWRRATTTPIDQANGALLGNLANLNRGDVLRSPWPAAVGIASANGLARLGAATLGPLDGRVVLTDAQRSDLVRPLSAGDDRVLGFPTSFGSGVQLPFPLFPMISAASWGHEAGGGSYLVVDPELGVSVGLTTDVFPALPGATLAGLSLLPTIRHLIERARTASA